ncbi:hypothetical protein QOZ80_3AG0251070 [Eleusine coracana subsp. coracana]|nr:hypothetical protein QOZ80_3AG0251070 [Eleusine coracana subsp. coracana]
MNSIYRLKSFDYPMPPPLVVEFNGRLLNHFEERFGECLAWEGYPFGFPPGGSSKYVWVQLQEHVATDIQHRVVSFASFNGCVRHFTCTGLLIKWPGSKATSRIIPTSASLVRSHEEESCAKDGIGTSSVKDDIDRKLRIEVFLPPPMQHVSGNLEYYNLNYNIAIVSVKKNFNGARPEDVFNEVHTSTDKVLAIGRDIQQVLLMASTGEVKHRRKACKLDCKDLQVSTCKINKVGIGGPLTYLNGSFVGMNFYDGSELTPFLPRSKIVKILKRHKDNRLPSESRLPYPVQIDGFVGGTSKINKWPVPEPYWWHGGLDVSMYPEHIGRVPN